MAADQTRPKPEQFLSMLREQQRGRLKVYLGFAPGVGKTYEMLQTARAKLREGVDVVVGVVETHGRRETEALLGDLEVIPRRVIEYKGRTLDEMDLDAVLRRRPALVLVDELIRFFFVLLLLFFSVSGLGRCSGSTETTWNSRKRDSTLRVAACCTIRCSSMPKRLRRRTHTWCMLLLLTLGRVG